MKKKDIDIWLRKECEGLETQSKYLEEKIEKVMKKGMFFELEKIFKLKSELDILRVQQMKLYEMLGRMNEIKGIETLEE